MSAVIEVVEREERKSGEYDVKAVIMNCSDKTIFSGYRPVHLIKNYNGGDLTTRGS